MRLTCIILQGLLLLMGIQGQETSFNLEWEASSRLSVFFQDGQTLLTGDSPEGETRLSLLWMEKIKDQPDLGWLIQFSGEADTGRALSRVDEVQGTLEILRVWEAGKKLGNWVAEAGITAEVRNRTTDGTSGGLSLRFRKDHGGPEWDFRWTPSFEFLFRPGGNPFWKAGLEGAASRDLGPASLTGQLRARADTRTDPRLRVDAASGIRFSFRPFRLILEPFRGDYQIYLPDWSGALASGQKVSYGSGLSLRFSADPAELQFSLGKAWWALNRSAFNAPRDLPWNGELSLKLQM